MSMLMGAVAVMFGLFVCAISNALSTWAANWHLTLRDEQKPSYAARKRQAIRIGAVCFMSFGGAILLVVLLVGLLSGRWHWITIAA